jgi:hypothetical protein
VDLIARLSTELRRLSFQRLDTQLPRKLDVLDGVRYVPEYATLGAELACQIDWGALPTA